MRHRGILAAGLVLALTPAATAQNVDSDLYVVWNETRLPTEARRALMLKYTHLIAF